MLDEHDTQYRDRQVARTRRVGMDDGVWHSVRSGISFSFRITNNFTNQTFLS